MNTGVALMMRTRTDKEEKVGGGVLPSPSLLPPVGKKSQSDKNVIIFISLFKDYPKTSLSFL